MGWGGWSFVEFVWVPRCVSRTLTLISSAKVRSAKVRWGAVLGLSPRRQRPGDRLLGPHHFFLAEGQQVILLIYHRRRDEGYLRRGVMFRRCGAEEISVIVQV